MDCTGIMVIMSGGENLIEGLEKKGAKEWLVSLFQDLSELPPMVVPKEVLAANGKKAFSLDRETFLETVLPEEIELDNLLAAFCNCGFNFELQGRYHPETRKLEIGHSPNIPEAQNLGGKNFWLANPPPSASFAPIGDKNNPDIIFHAHPLSLCDSSFSARPSYTDSKMEVWYNKQGKRFTSIIAAGIPESNEVTIYTRKLDRSIEFPRNFFSIQRIDPSVAKNYQALLDAGNFYFSRDYFFKEPLTYNYELTEEQISLVVRMMEHFIPTYKCQVPRFSRTDSLTL